MPAIFIDGPGGLVGIGDTLEAAEIDLEAQERGLPAWRLLGGVDPTPRPIGQVCFSAGEIAQALAAGVRTIKIKSVALGDPRHTYALRIDLNRRTGELDRAVSLAPELIEEPGELEHLSRAPSPLAVDESLAEEGGVDRARELIARGIVSAVVLKPMRLGMRKSLALARLGAEAIVTHVFDGPLGHAAAMHVAFALPPGRFAHGLGLHAGLTPGEVAHVSGGVIVAPTFPGVVAPDLRRRLLAARTG